MTLRNRLHVNQPPNNSGPNGGASAPLSKSPEKGGVPSSPAPAVPPRTTLPLSGTLPHGLGHPSGHTLTASAIVHPHVNHAGANTLGHNSTAANNLISGQYAAVHALHAFRPSSMPDRCRRRSLPRFPLLPSLPRESANFFSPYDAYDRGYDTFVSVLRHLAFVIRPSVRRGIYVTPMDDYRELKRIMLYM